MRWLFCALVLLTISAPVLLAQEQPNPDEIKRLSEQLKAAQDRKNQLAAENEKLIAKVAELQKQLDASQASYAEKTFQWRATNAAWETFIRRYPALMGKWHAFLQSSLLDAPGDLQWMTHE